VPQAALAPVPAGLTCEQAAALPQAGAIALQGIRDAGRVQPGQKVLINGGGGGSGMYAVQLAKLDGAEVTGVDNAETSPSGSFRRGRTRTQRRTRCAPPARPAELALQHATAVCRRSPTRRYLKSALGCLPCSFTRL
jgi:D-arabinose 1-dehydrogenase-like Zn-dependent alcohol dehydrogenase